MLVIAYPYMTFFYNVMIHVQQMTVDGLSSRLLVSLGLARSNLMLYLGQIIQSFYISCSLCVFLMYKLFYCKKSVLKSVE